MNEDIFSNEYISQLLNKVAAAYEILGEDRFKTRAYTNAATSVEQFTSDIRTLWQQGKILEVPGMGSSIAGHLDEYFKTGKSTHFDHILGQMPPGMFALFGLSGIGAKTAYKLSMAFKIKSREEALDTIKKAAEEGKIQLLEGFGAKKEAEILEAIKRYESAKEEGFDSKKRILLPIATEIAERYMAYVKECEYVIRAEMLGSLRRRVATIGDIDIAVSTNNPIEVVKHFIQFSDIKKVLSEGDIKASVILGNGIRVDLMTEKPESFGSLLQHFTGSKTHNIFLRKYALNKGMSLSEHGIKVDGDTKKFSTEEDFYRFIGLDCIPPEMREGYNEIELAETNSLPELITYKDIKGDLHTHTIFSDGKNSLEEMIDAAIEKNYEYLGVSDHAPSIKTRGENEVMSIILDTRKNIDHINSSQNKIRVLYGYEVDILTDATLQLPDEYLSKLDYAIASIHTSQKQNKELINKRLLSAIKNPYITFIAHPTGRLLNNRESYEADWELIFKEGLQFGKIFEVNSHPERLDLPDVLIREAIKKGLKLIINTDAHHRDHFNLIRYGVDTARRGWAKPEDVVNTLPLKKFLKVFNLKG